MNLIKIIFSIVFLSIIVSCSSDVDRKEMTDIEYADYLVEHQKYKEALNVVEGVLVNDPFHEGAFMRWKLIKAKLPQKTVKQE